MTFTPCRLPSLARAVRLVGIARPRALGESNAECCCSFWVSEGRGFSRAENGAFMKLSSRASANRACEASATRGICSLGTQLQIPHSRSFTPFGRASFGMTTLWGGCGAAEAAPFRKIRTPPASPRLVGFARLATLRESITIPPSPGRRQISHQLAELEPRLTCQAIQPLVFALHLLWHPLCILSDN